MEHSNQPEVDSTNLANVSTNVSSFGHLLHTPWTMWYNSSNAAWNPTSIFTLKTVEEYWALYKNIMFAGDLPVGAEYFLFRQGVRPEWEDEKNQNGGNCSVHLPYDVETTIADDAWKWLSLSAIGETIPYAEEITGVVFSRKKISFRLSIWLKTSNNSKAQAAISDYFVKGLRLNNSFQIEFTYHSSKYNKTKD